MNFSLRKLVQCAAVSGTTLLASGAAFADPDGAGCNPERMRAMHGAMSPAVTHPAMPARGGRTLAALKLSDSQEESIFKLHHALEEKMFANRRALRKAMSELNDMGKAERFDEAKARTLAETQGKLIADGILQHAQIHSQVRALLTKDQREQFDRIDSPMGEHGPMGEPGRMGMHHPMAGARR